MEHAVLRGAKALNKREGSVSSGFAFGPSSDWDEMMVGLLLVFLELVFVGRDCISCSLTGSFGGLTIFLGILRFSDFEDG